MDIKNANELVRGDRINASAVVDAALGESDERFFFDNLDNLSPGAVDSMVEGCSNHNGCTTVYTADGAFSCPDDFPVRIVAYAGDY